MYLIGGLMCRYMDGRDGKRQLVAVHCPMTSSICMPIRSPILQHDKATITAYKVGIVPHDTIACVPCDNPHLAYTMWLSKLLEAATQHRCSTTAPPFASFAKLLALLRPDVDLNYCSTS